MAGSPRQLHTQQIHFLRKGITFADKLTTVTLGYIPAGSVVIKPMSGVHVSTVFNGTAPQTLDIGTSVTTAIWATALALSVTTFVACNETTTSFYVSSDTTVQAVIGGSGATAGEAQLIIAYVPNTDG